MAQTGHDAVRACSAYLSKTLVEIVATIQWFTGLPNAQPSKKRKKQSNSDLPPLQSDGMSGRDVDRAAGSLPEHGSLPAQLGALQLLQSLLQVGVLGTASLHVQKHVRCVIA